MPSPMAFNPSSLSQSMFQRKKSQSSLSSAAEYLAAVKHADAKALAKRGGSPTPTATPALSFSSSATAASSTTSGIALEDDQDMADDPFALPAVPPTSEQVFTTVHTEFGHCANPDYRFTSQHTPGADIPGHVDQDPPYYILLTTYISYLILICMGHVRDFFGKRAKSSEYRDLMPANGYAPLNSDFDSFYTRRLKSRIEDCFAVPVTGVAGRTIMIYDRYTDNNYKTNLLTGSKTRTLNISSYNYLGFAQAHGGCADAVEESIRRHGIVSGGARLDAGSLDLHVTGEALVAKFVGKEDALIHSMGFATNSTIIPALVSKGCLVISDEYNHASIRVGVRQSGANVRMFKHNDMSALETLLREVISQGQPKTHRPWKKIMLIVEGLYSMEGTMLNLPVILELKKKYKFYLFVDEAHSIGAVGPHGRGVCDYYGVDPRSVDILMGTFTKSFGAAGGYISGSKAIIDSLRLRGHSGPYAEAMSPPVLTQIIASMSSIMGIAPPLVSPSASTSTITLHQHDAMHPGPAPAAMLPSWMDLPRQLADGSEGQERLRRLTFNSRYLSRGLKRLGFIVYGHPNSPIVPLLLFNPGKMGVFWRMMRQRATPIIVVVVAYPATPLVTSRVRFCVSASHTKEDIDAVLRACDEIGDVLDLKVGEAERWPIERIVADAVELVHAEHV